MGVHSVPSATSSRTVVVLGLHRSGTSMVAGALDALGVNMGASPRPGRINAPSWSNPTGYFEDAAFVSLNRRIIEHVRLRSRNSTLAPRQVLEHAAISKELRHLVSYPSDPLWGWKDPQTILTIQEFLPYLTNPHFVVCRRETDEIIQSFRRREWFTEREIGAIIAEYSAQLVALSSVLVDYPQLEVDYHKAVLDPANMVNSMCSFLNISPSSQMRNRATKIVMVREQLSRESMNIAVRAVLKFPERLLVAPWSIRRLDSLPPAVGVFSSVLRESFSMARDMVRKSSHSRSTPGSTEHRPAASPSLPITIEDSNYSE